MSNDTNPQTYLAVWSGGYETPQYEAFATADAALERAADWRDDASDDDTIDVLSIDQVTREIKVLG